MYLCITSNFIITGSLHSNSALNTPPELSLIPIAQTSPEGLIEEMYKEGLEGLEKVSDEAHQSEGPESDKRRIKKVLTYMPGHSDGKQRATHDKSSGNQFL